MTLEKPERVYLKCVLRGDPAHIVLELKERGIVGSVREAVVQGLFAFARAMSPKYRLVEEVAQTILDEYILPRQIDEISYRIVFKVRDLRIPFRTPDIAYIAAQYLHEQGVKVWR